MNPMEYLSDSAVTVVAAPPRVPSAEEKDGTEECESDEKKAEEKKPATPAGEEKPKKDDRPLIAVVIRYVSVI